MAVEKEEVRSRAVKIRVGVIAGADRGEVLGIEEPDEAAGFGNRSQTDRVLVGAGAVDALIQAVMEEVQTIAAAAIRRAKPEGRAGLSFAIRRPVEGMVGGQVELAGQLDVPTLVGVTSGRIGDAFGREKVVVVGGIELGRETPLSKVPQARAAADGGRGAGEDGEHETELEGEDGDDEEGFDESEPVGFGSAAAVGAGGAGASGGPRGGRARDRSGNGAGAGAGVGWRGSRAWTNGDTPVGWSRQIHGSLLVVSARTGAPLVGAGEQANTSITWNRGRFFHRSSGDPMDAGRVRRPEGDRIQRIRREARMGGGPFRPLDDCARGRWSLLLKDRPRSVI